jgi:hypothetical protein
VRCTITQPSLVEFFSAAMMAPPGAALTFVPLGSVSVTSTTTLQACFVTDWARQAVADPSNRNATANNFFIELPGFERMPAGRWSDLIKIRFKRG